MATPPQVNSKAMSGKFLMNKALSDSAEEILRLQGLSWFTRRAIATFSLTIVVKHSTDEAGVEHINIDQILSGGIPGTDESHVLDWVERDERDDVFGPVIHKARRIPVREITDEFLKKDWSQDTIDDDIVLTEAWSSPGKSSYTWKAIQTWGFATVNGERRHVRNTTFTSSRRQEGPIHARFVYDYLGAA